MNDKIFDHLEANLRRIDRRNDYFNAKLVLPSLNKGGVDKFLEKLLPNTRLIITPKIVGCAIALSYENGSLIKAISRKGKDVTKVLKTVENIPHNILTKSTLHVKGELFSPALEPARSQRLTSGFLRKNDPTGKGLSFCSFQILNGELNYYSSLKVLEMLGFQIPDTEFTHFTSEVQLYRQLWKEGKLSKQFPIDGIVLTINSRKLQKQLESKYNDCSQWQYAIKD